MMNGDDYAIYLEREETLDKILCALSNLPSYDTIMAKLGSDAAQQYLQWSEAIQSFGDDSFAYVDVDSSNTHSPQQCREAMQILEIVATNITDQYAIVDAYEELQGRIKRERNAHRHQLALVNQPIRERALQLKIWFPVRTATERERWARIGGGIELYTLAEAVRQLLKAREPGLVQHIPKQKISTPTVLLIETNIATMRAFLLQYG